MAYDIQLADRIRYFLANIPSLKVQEKTMFSGLAFLVNGKMCVNVSHDNMMCRIDADAWPMAALKKGFVPMFMRGKELKSYCYVTPEGYKGKKDFEFWMQLCLAFNPKAKAASKSRTSGKKKMMKKVKAASSLKAASRTKK